MFDRHFEAFLADIEPARETHFRLRYQVYCLDTGWEDASRFPDQMERDEYDAASVPFLIRRRRTNAWIASMRFIRKPIEQLPISRFTRFSAHQLPASARDRIIELSRLCVVKKYRRPPKRRISGEMPAWQVAANADDSFLASGYRASESWIFLGLIRAGWQWSLENGVDYWIFFIADSLARIIQRSGFTIEPVGDEVEHRGLRRPYLFEVTPFPPNETKAPDVAAMFRRTPAYRLFSALGTEAAGVRRGPR